MNDLICGIVRVVVVTDTKAWVESEAKSACGSCAMAKGCGTKVISGYFGKNAAPFEMANDFEGAVGDRLEIGIENTAILKASALIYLLPLAGLVIGAILGAALNTSDIFSAGLGLIGLMAGFFLARHLSAATSIMPVFLKKLESTEEKQ